ncbi:hypothetical protein F4804DRAFT_332233 [Jackrogersella minutella]|nr:hypothetical protein F4804DRAFT_332233 [Jackrogersella minutella]
MGSESDWQDVPVDPLVGKLNRMLALVKQDPEVWFGPTIDPRDHSLIYCDPVDFVDFNKSSYLAKIGHYEPGEETKPMHQTIWTFDGDAECKAMIAHCGGKFYPFKPPPPSQTDYELHMKGEFDVKISVPTKSVARYGAGWGILSARPRDVRIMMGLEAFYPGCICHAMVLRDCTASEEGHLKRTEIGTRKWDILLMRIAGQCVFPWIPVAIRDSGSAAELEGTPQECYPEPPHRI